MQNRVRVRRTCTLSLTTDGRNIEPPTGIEFQPTFGGIELCRQDETKERRKVGRQDVKLCSN